MFWHIVTAIKWLDALHFTFHSPWVNCYYWLNNKNCQSSTCEHANRRLLGQLWLLLCKKKTLREMQILQHQSFLLSCYWTLWEINTLFSALTIQTMENVLHTTAHLKYPLHTVLVYPNTWKETVLTFNQSEDEPSFMPLCRFLIFVSSNLAPTTCLQSRLRATETKVEPEPSGYG